MSVNQFNINLTYSLILKDQSNQSRKELSFQVWELVEAYHRQ